MVNYIEQNDIYIIDEYTRCYYQSIPNGLSELFKEISFYELKPPRIIAVSLNVVISLIYTKNSSVTSNFPQYHLLCNPEVKESIFNYQQLYNKLNDHLEYIEYSGEVLRILFSQNYIYNSLYLISVETDLKSFNNKEILSSDLYDKLKINQIVSISSVDLNLIIDYIYNKMAKKYKSEDKLKAVIKYVMERKK